MAVRFIVFDYNFKPIHNEHREELTIATHITRSVIDVFFRKNVMRLLFCRFQNVSF